MIFWPSALTDFARGGDGFVSKCSHRKMCVHAPHAAYSAL